MLIRDDTGRETDQGSWSIRTGAGRTRVERATDKSPLAYLVLLDRLQADDDWKRNVERVEHGEDALEVARSYGNGLNRRRVIAEMLTRRGSAIAYTVPDESGPQRDAGNRYSASFWLRTIRGAECIVRLGAGRCLTCDDELADTRRESSGPVARTARVLYCPTCAADEVADRDAIADVFRRVAGALALR